MVDWDDYVGRFEAIQDVEVRPRVSGQITRIGFRDGLKVGKDQFLFQIDPRPYAAALAQARADEGRSRGDAWQCSSGTCEGARRCSVPNSSVARITTGSSPPSRVR